MLKMTSGVKRKEPASNFSDESNSECQQTSHLKKPCLSTSQDAGSLSGHADMETDQYFNQRTLPNLPLGKVDESDPNYCNGNNNNYFHCNLNNNNYLPPQQECTRCLAGEAGHFNHLS